MVNESDIGKIVQATSGSRLSGELLGFDEKGRAKVKRPLGVWHASVDRVAVMEFASEIDQFKQESKDDVISRLCNIIIEEYPSDDSRSIYARKHLSSLDK